MEKEEIKMTEQTWTPFYDRKSYPIKRERTNHRWHPPMGRIPTCGECIAYYGEPICEDMKTCPHKKAFKEMQPNEHKENAQ